MENSKKKGLIFLAGILVVVAIVVSLGISATKNIGKTTSTLTFEDSKKNLDKMVQNINVAKLEPVKTQVTSPIGDVKDTLPEIDKYPMQVTPTSENSVEIFSSPEKAGTGKDSWLIEVATRFNDANISVNGSKASIGVRSIASGLGTDYIISGKYIPDAFTPSNEFWISMIKASGTKTESIADRLVGNVPGIILSDSMADTIKSKYGSVTIENINKAVENGEMAMGYTNPFSSSTGLNYLVSTLYTYDNSDILSDTAVAGFERFQANIPFVAYTTLQMRESAKSGVLDGFILEYQLYKNTADLRTGYTFIPFGIRHDNPLYSIGELTAEKKAILKEFAKFCASTESQALAKEYGFNYMDDYKPTMKLPTGDELLQAQSLWKQKKDVTKDIATVFVSDVSGSMEGDSMNAMKTSLLNGSQYINKDVSLGFVTFSHDVQIALPLAKFDMNQRALFAGAIESMNASGGTAMYDGILVGAQMLLEYKAQHPNATLMLFVATDGETSEGHNFKKVKETLKGLNIPIYTIGYNADLSILEELSNLNEAASINADSDDVIYKLGSLFNAQM